MRTDKIFTIFSTHIKTNVIRSEFFTQTLHKQLKMPVIQRIELRQILIIISQSHKRIKIIQRSFMHTTHSPLTTTLKTTTYTTPTRQLQRTRNIIPTKIISKNDASIRALKSRDRMEAGHIKAKTQELQLLDLLGITQVLKKQRPQQMQLIQQ